MGCLQSLLRTIPIFITNFTLSLEKAPRPQGINDLGSDTATLQPSSYRYPKTDAGSPLLRSVGFVLMRKLLDLKFGFGLLAMRHVAFPARSGEGLSIGRGLFHIA